MYQRSILILPDDTLDPILDAIDGARKSLRIKIFLFSDPVLINAVIAAKVRGVRVKVMLNPARRNGVEENSDTRILLQTAGIEVRDSNPAFGLTHEKSMVVDDTVAFIQSLNWDIRGHSDVRDYAVITNHPHEVKEVINCFEADWDRRIFDSGDTAHLVWCIGNGRHRIARFIDDAVHSLYVQNDRFQDLVIIERLIRAHKRGVKVHVLVRPPHTLKKEKLVEAVSGLRIMEDLGIKVHQIRHLKMHGKMLLADGMRTMIGSINLAPGSFDDRRELAIECHDEQPIHRLKHVVHADWERSAPLDLTDKALYEDLARRLEGGSELFNADPEEYEHHRKN